MGVLDGVTVLERPAGIAGAMAGMLLADNGADVIKIDVPLEGPITNPTVWDRGKRLVSSFGETVDVVIESEGRDWSAGDERLITCSITGYGRGNRHSDRPNVDALVAARMGLHWDQRGLVGGQPVAIAGVLPTGVDLVVPPGAEQTGHREGPIFMAPPWNSIGAALLAVTGISAALRAREITGRGQWVETSLLQGGLLTTVPTWQRVPDPLRDGYRLPYFDRRCPKGFFRCADGLWLHQWAPIHHAFVQAAASGGELRRPEASELASAPRPPAGYDGQLAFELEQHPLTAAAFARFPRDDWVRLFAEAGLPAQPVLSPEEGLLDPHSLADGCVALIDGTYQVGQVYRMSETGGAVTAPTSRRPLGSPLEGITVLDLGLAMAGPYGAQTLADLGANVIKVNNPGERGAPVSSPVVGCNRGKRSIAIDLKDPRGKAVLHRLVAAADVVHHNMRLGVAERLGADYDTVRAINPAIVYCHTRGFEATGPRAALPGNDQMGQALAGTWWEMGACHDGGEPTWHPAALGDFGNGVMSAVAVIQALYHRERTGGGQFVDTSIINMGFLYNSSTFARPDGTGPERPRLDVAQTGLSALYRLYETADGWLCLAVRNDDEWDALVGVIGDDLGVADDDAKRADVIGAALARRSAAEWQAVFDAAGVPCEIADPGFAASLFDDPDLIARNWVVGYPHAVLGHLEQAGHLIEFSATPGLIQGPAPVVGQHTRELLGEHGFSPEEIGALLAANVVAEA